MADEVGYDNDCPPPLEDMSAMIKQANKMRQSKRDKPKPEHTSPSPDKPTSKTPPCMVSNQKPQTKPSDEKKFSEQNTPHPVSTKKAQRSDGFAGMKKGFLSDGPPKKPVAKPVKEVEEDIPFIQPKANKVNDLHLPEVENAMKVAHKFKENKEWITEDLLEKVIKKGRMGNQIANPKFMAIIKEFETDLPAAMQKYANDKTTLAFFKDFCDIMADHFNELGEQQHEQQGPIKTTASQGADLSVRSSTDPNQPTAADEQRMQEIMSDPEVRRTLMDPQVQQMFTILRTDPDAAQSTLRKSSPELMAKLQKLADVGLLQFLR